ncbi:MAG: GNAT family N-acetyltransferase [Synergistaceae bacterium]|jgi:ribosomal protein S18 acetylase RimI-like enzyme|nr:GNAT family N-acetyltransferase [Synergistaceae bacterium]
MKNAKDVAVEIVRDGNIEQCRELCNELMAFQKSKAVIAPDAFDWMNFDTRMKKSCESAPASQVIVARDGDVPVGYVFSTLQKPERDKGPYPAWLSGGKDKETLGFYPDWEELPPRIGCLSNIYFRDEYRGMGLGSRLFGMAMDWFWSFPDISLVFIYVSNGNDAAFDFYLGQGFTFSHDVYGGFIKAVYRFIR